jgi:hypothetical protein
VLMQQGKVVAGTDIGSPVYQASGECKPPFS